MKPSIIMQKKINCFPLAIYSRLEDIEIYSFFFSTKKLIEAECENNKVFDHHDGLAKNVQSKHLIQTQRLSTAIVLETWNMKQSCRNEFLSFNNIE